MIEQYLWSLAFALTLISAAVILHVVRFVRPGPRPVAVKIS